MFGLKAKFGLFFTLVLIVALSSSVYPQDEVKKRPPQKSNIPEVPLVDAVITFDHDEFDFGDVPPGSKVTHAFPVENRGVDTLNITAIKAG